MKFLMILIFTSVFKGSGVLYNIDDQNIKTECINTMANGKIKITVNSQSFTATLLDNDSAKAFMIMLPMTIHMTELNSNEKYYDLPNSIPTNSSNPGTIKNGDLMLYGSKTFVLFYKTFSTAYSYTKLGTLDDATGLASALGSGNVTVTFAVE
ncbi:cyclophilin-like fold protein [Algoriphagus aquimarinus]|uniref:cyclophilin-like fold protein n=1 Tax=Algoriphagus aquimarinus TaxID=237018 RepID=UPI0030D77AD8|tara:strand:- start:28234 stop:28692 length:459 start_codon:yes stop_codon:yes gene_type:complete